MGQLALPPASYWPHLENSFLANLLQDTDKTNQLLTMLLMRNLTASAPPPSMAPNNSHGLPPNNDRAYYGGGAGGRGGYAHPSGNDRRTAAKIDAEALVSGSLGAHVLPSMITGGGPAVMPNVGSISDSLLRPPLGSFGARIPAVQLVGAQATPQRKGDRRNRRSDTRSSLSEGRLRASPKSSGTDAAKSPSGGDASSVQLPELDHVQESVGVKLRDSVRDASLVYSREFLLKCSASTWTILPPVNFPYIVRELNEIVAPFPARFRYVPKSESGDASAENSAPEVFGAEKSHKDDVAPREDLPEVVAH